MKKVQLKSRPAILGIEYDLLRQVLEITEGRKDELQKEIEQILKVKRLSPGQAAKLKGKLMFAASQLWEKLGRAYLLALSERQYTKVYREGVDKALKLSLEAWLRLLELAPRRELKPLESDAVDVVLFTDGYYPDSRKGESGKAQVGAVLFAAGGTTQPLYLSEQLEQRTVDTWLTRQNQISMVELFAPVLALFAMEEAVRGKKLLLFVDSEAVEGALVKGYSSREDLSELVGKFWEQAARLDCLVYVCRVSTDGNPADGPSRPGKCTPAPELHWKRVTTTLVHELAHLKTRAWERGS